eukprot:4222150-Amphidinium_carterae.2
MLTGLGVWDIDLATQSPQFPHKSYDLRFVAGKNVWKCRRKKMSHVHEHSSLNPFSLMIAIEEPGKTLMTYLNNI